MNKIIIATMPWIFAAIGYKATAQETTTQEKKDSKKETQVITIKKTGDKNADLKIEFKDDKVLINGKPLVEFKDESISVNNKKIIVKEGSKWSLMGDDGKAAIEMDMSSFDGLGDRIVRGFAYGGSSSFLGVTTSDDDAGAKITEVTKGSAAEKAGLQKADIITQVGDTKIADPSDLSEAIAAKKPKDEVKITYRRDGKEKTTKATLQERKNSQTHSYSFVSPRGGYKTLTVPGYPATPATPGAPRAFFRDNDFEFDNLTVQGFGRQRLGLKIQDLEEGSGVKVLSVDEGSAAEKAGIKKDDIITAVGDKKVENTDDAREELHKNAEKSAYSIEAKRNGSPLKFDIKIPKKLKTANL
ncbi:MAG: PDZ domain-containing protein [Chitinophagaceae bacterium]|nr:MAG: PDZ domain-containing protein [Chitinophagaceae bacterium]